MEARQGCRVSCTWSWKWANIPSAFAFAFENAATATATAIKATRLTFYLTLKNFCIVLTISSTSRPRTSIYDSINMYIRKVKDCTISRLLSMAKNMLFMMVGHAQKVKGEALNLNPSIAPCGHRVRRGNTREKYAKF